MQQVAQSQLACPWDHAIHMPSQPIELPPVALEARAVVCERSRDERAPPTAPKHRVEMPRTSLHAQEELLDSEVVSVIG